MDRHVNILNTKNLLIDCVLLKLESGVRQTLIIEIPILFKNIIQVAEIESEVPLAETNNDSTTLMRIAEELCDLEERQRADQVVMKIPKQHQKGTSFVEVLIKLGRLDEARAAANDIPDKLEKSEALEQVVGAFIETGRLDDARVAANGIPEVLWQKSVTLKQVVGAFIEAGRLDDARAAANDIPGRWRSGANKLLDDKAVKNESSRFCTIS